MIFSPSECKRESRVRTKFVEMHKDSRLRCVPGLAYGPSGRWNYCWFQGEPAGNVNVLLDYAGSWALYVYRWRMLQQVVSNGKGEFPKLAASVQKLSKCGQSILDSNGW